MKESFAEENVQNALQHDYMQVKEFGKQKKFLQTSQGELERRLAPVLRWWNKENPCCGRYAHLERNFHSVVRWKHEGTFRRTFKRICPEHIQGWPEKINIKKSRNTSQEKNTNEGACKMNSFRKESLQENVFKWSPYTLSESHRVMK